MKKYITKVLLSLVLLVNMVAISNAQSKYQEGDNLYFKNGTLLDDADFYFQEEDFTTALPLYLDLEQQYHADVLFIYRIGVCYLYKTDELNKSVEYLKLAETKDSTIKYLSYYLGKAYYLNYQFDKAASYFDKFVSQHPFDKKADEAKLLSKNSKNAQVIFQSKYNYNVFNLDTAINTIYSEYAPVYVKSLNKLFFTFRGDTTKRHIDDKTYISTADFYEDIFASTIVNNGYTKPYNIGKTVNTKKHDASVSISKDENTFYIYKNVKNKSGGDIYYSKIVNGQFSEPMALTSINSKHWEGSAAVSKDGKLFIFSSDRPGGVGGRDLYIAELQSDGNWGNIKNLGASVNSNLDEDGPYFGSDGKSFYYSSKGLTSIGGYDIFKCPVENGQVGTPENIGYPANSLSDDIYLFEDNENGKFYFSSNRSGSIGLFDLYYFEIEKEKRTSPYTLVNGSIVSSDTTKNVNKIKVYYTDATTGAQRLLGVFSPNKFSKTYDLNIPAGSNYDLVSTFTPNNEQTITHLDLSKNAIKEIKRDIDLNPATLALTKKEDIINNKTKETSSSELNVATNNPNTSTSEVKDKEVATAVGIKTNSIGSYQLRPIYFKFDSYAISAKDKKYLRNVAKQVKKNKVPQVEIVGYTDIKGSSQYNKRLSQKRAKSVANYLVTNGVPRKKLKIIGAGEDQSQSSHALSRRVEILPVVK